jgi:hypothetical protein
MKLRGGDRKSKDHRDPLILGEDGMPTQNGRATRPFSSRRFWYLQVRVCKENNINYSTGKSAVAGYKRLRQLEIVDRSTIVSALLSGELFWSKAERRESREDCS